VKVSRKGDAGHPPSSRSASRQKSHRLSKAPATARPPSMLNKNPLLPPIGTAAPAAGVSLSPSSNSSASVPLALSATPAPDASSHPQSSSSVKDASVLPSGSTATPNRDRIAKPVPHSERDIQFVPTGVVAGSKHESGHIIATADDLKSAKSQSCTSDASERAPAPPPSILTPELFERQSSSKAACADASASEAKSNSRLPSEQITSEDIVDLPLPSPGSAQLKVTDAACQCDEVSSVAKCCASGTQAYDDAKQPLATSMSPAAGETSVSSARRLPDKNDRAGRLSKELVSGTSVLGFSPSPSRRLRSGASSRTARKFHGLSAQEIQTVSTVLNTLARSQSRAAGSAAAAGGSPPVPMNNAEARVPTAERLRLTVSYVADVKTIGGMFCEFFYL